MALPALVSALGVLLLGIAAPAAAEDPRQELVPRFRGAALVEKLKAGGKVILMRHMATTPEADRWEGVDLGDCGTQRELSEEGRVQARRLGEAFGKLGIQVGKIFVSPYCRCRETARLAFGREGVVSPTLSIWDRLSMEEKTAKGVEIRKMLDTAPAKPGINTLLITHTGNLLWSYGLDAKPEGLAHVFEPSGLPIHRPTYLGRLDPGEWASLVGGGAEAPADPVEEARP